MPLAADRLWKKNHDSLVFIPRSASLERRPEIGMEGLCPSNYSGSVPLYRALKHRGTVRFIKILPAKVHEPLELTLVYADILEAMHTYDALSYAWGDTKNTHTIYVDHRPFQIRDGAYGFLRRLRTSGATGLLWMDSICINQDDLSERTQQVRIMHHIYRLARTVIVWLGSEADNSALAMQYAAKLDGVQCVNEYFHQSGAPGAFGNCEYRMKSKAYNDLTETSGNVRLLRSMDALLKRPWLRRVWIQQETVLCHTVRVLCGADEVTWEQYFGLLWVLWPRSMYAEAALWLELILERNVLEDIIAAATCIQNSRQSHLQHPFCVHRTWQRRVHGLSHSITFPVMMKDISVCQATDPRDMVYAVLELGEQQSSRCQVPRPVPDYTIAWPTVYLKTAQWMYDMHGMHTLESAGRSAQYGRELPSWAPDWRAPHRRAFVHHRFWSAGGLDNAYYRRFANLSAKALPAYKLDVVVVPEGSARPKKRLPIASLDLNAIMLDRIVYKSDCVDQPLWQVDTKGLISQQLAENGEFADDLHRAIRDDLKYVHSTIDRYFTGESAEDAYAATILCNTTDGDALARPEYERNFFRSVETWLEAGSQGPCPVSLDTLNISPARRWTCFAMTAHGYMCVVPSMAQVGDYVAAMHGVRLPYALRRVEDASKQCYEVLGPSYVHRIMRCRLWNLIGDFKCKYKPGSEDEEVPSLVPPEGDDDGPCETFPFNAKKEYSHMLKVLGKRRITLV